MEQRAAARAIRSHRITGGAGTTLHVVETGNENGRPVLFIHGLSQCALAWRKQLRSSLGNDLRLVAMDLRGHGQSERPPDGYDDQSLWADDVHAVITTLNWNAQSCAAGPTAASSSATTSVATENGNRRDMPGRGRVAAR